MREMISYEQLDKGLELVDNGEAFIMTHPVYGTVRLTRDGEWIQVDLCRSEISIWCSTLDLGMGMEDKLMFWLEGQVIGMIDAKGLEVA